MRRLLHALLAGLLLTALSLAAPPERGEEWVRQRARAVKDSDTDAWRRIPWTGSLLAARSASAAEKKPVFLFTHDGNIDTGRC